MYGRQDSVKELVKDIGATMRRTTKTTSQVDAQALAAELAASSTARFVSTTAAAPLCTERFQLPPGADRRRHPQKHRRCDSNRAACRRYRRASPIARRRDEPRRADLQRRRRHGHSKYLHRILELDPHDKRARVQPGLRARRFPQRRGSSTISRSARILPPTTTAPSAA